MQAREKGVEIAKYGRGKREVREREVRDTHLTLMSMKRIVLQAGISKHGRDPKLILEGRPLTLIFFYRCELLAAGFPSPYS